MEVACKAGSKVLGEFSLLISYTSLYLVHSRRDIQCPCRLFCWATQPNRISSCPSGGRQLLGWREYLLGTLFCSKVRTIGNLGLAYFRYIDIIFCRYQIKELAKRNCWHYNYVLLCSQSASAKEAAARQRFVKINVFVFSRSYRLAVKDVIPFCTYPHLYPFSLAVRNLIPWSSLESLMQWGRRHYGYLFDNPSLQQKSHSVFRSTKFCTIVHFMLLFFSPEIVNFLSSCDLGKESLIHFRAKLLSLISSRVILIADEPGIEIHLYL